MVLTVHVVYLFHYFRADCPCSNTVSIHAQTSESFCFFSGQNAEVGASPHILAQTEVQVTAQAGAVRATEVSV